MTPYKSIVTYAPENSDRIHTYLRVSEPGKLQNDMILSAPEMVQLISDLGAALQRELQYKNYDYHTTE